MVAIHPHLALVAVSLVSLSLAPSAAAAAINSRSAGPESSSKSVRQLPMPLRARRSATKDGLKTKPGRGFGESRRRQFLKSRTGGVESPLGEARRQEQVHFFTKNRGHAKARDVPQCTSGHVNITQANSDGSSMSNMTIGYLVLNNDTTPPELDASTTSQTTLQLVQFDDSRCTLRKDIYVPAQNQTITHCATYNRQPRTPEPLKMCPCDAPATCGPNASQDFSYNSDTGVIQPIWSDGGSNNDTSTASAEDVNDPDTNDAEMDDADNGDSDSALAARDTPPTNVTLVWVPEECPVSAQEVPSDSQSSASSATMTETITTTVTASMYSSSAADATPSSTTDSSSQLTSTATDVSPVPSPSALNVELAVPSSTDPAGTAASTGTTATGSSAIATDTVNAGSITTSSDSSAPSSMTSDTVAPSDTPASTSSTSPTASADAAAEPTSSVAPPTSEEQALYVVNARGAAEW